MAKYLLLIFAGSFNIGVSHSQDSTFIKVHFLYGSKPLREYRDTEKRWFGGTMGGHVGIEGDTNAVLNFHHRKSLHLFSSRTNLHSSFLLNSGNEFWGIFGGKADSVKKTTIVIPVSRQQKEKFDSISGTYLSKTPYDYAVIGMRCGAASYDILAQLGIVKRLTNPKTYMKIFYPKKLRSRLLASAEKNGWAIIKQGGTSHRKWETD